MNVKELRIGNAVNSPRGIETILFAESLQEIESYPDNFCGIKLTKEMLLKITTNILRSFFFSTDAVFYLVSDDWAFRLKKHGVTICKIDYLHQLQNIYFDISGEDLDISKIIGE